jgi:light-regulated signal transduction histidine kinase (bacteriophytochrome)
VQLLANRYEGQLDADADEFIAFAVDGAMRMQRLIQDLLAYSRTGTSPMDVTMVSSESALRIALSNLETSIIDSGARVTHGILPAVEVDETQLVQLFQNLVGNALKYHGEAPPEVEVSAKRISGRWYFFVRDNGLGIEAQYHDRIFGMFQRLHNRTEFSGTGIGLAICRKIVERNGGEITVTSDLGSGSTFRFCLGEHAIGGRRRAN